MPMENSVSKRYRKIRKITKNRDHIPSNVLVKSLLAQLATTELVNINGRKQRNKFGNFSENK